MPDVKHDLDYDSRKKQLTHKTTQKITEGDDDLGVGSLKSKRTYTEDEIKRIYKDLQGKITNLDQNISQQKDKLEDVPEMTDELEEFKEKLQKVKEIEENKNESDKLEGMKEQRKRWKKHKKRIKDAIGDQLDL